MFFINDYSKHKLITFFFCEFRTVYRGEAGRDLARRLCTIFTMVDYSSTILSSFFFLSFLCFELCTEYGSEAEQNLAKRFGQFPPWLLQQHNLILFFFTLLNRAQK